MADRFVPNSHRSKEHRALKPVVQGSVHTRTNNGSIRDALLSEDAENVGSYLLGDVIIPAFKEMICDAVCNGVKMVLGVETYRPRTGRNNTPTYREYYSRENQNNYSYCKPFSYEEPIFESMGDAQVVLMQMVDTLEDFGAVSVANLLESCGITPNFTDNKYGWTDLSTAHVVRVRVPQGLGYVIRMPKPTLL